MYLPAVSESLTILTTSPRFRPKYFEIGSFKSILGSWLSFTLLHGNWVKIDV